MSSDKLATKREAATITEWWKDGSVSIEWIDNESREKVIGDFMQIGPMQSVAAFVDRTERMRRSAAALSQYLRRGAR